MDTSERSFSQRSIFCFLFVFLLVLCYVNTFHNSWHLDDKPNILDNANIHLTSLSPEHIWKCLHTPYGNQGINRPLARLTLALNWFVDKDNVTGYHIVNLLIHATTSCILFLTLLTLFQTPRLQNQYSKNQYFFISALATLFWALNPVHTQAVTYIVQRMTTMAAFFTIVSIFFYLKGRTAPLSKKQTIFFLSSALSFLLALLSKENAIILPFLLITFELLFFQSRKIFSKKNVLSFVGLFLLCFVLGIAIRPEAISFIANFYENRPFTLIQRLLTEQRILLLYLSLLFFPAPGRLSIEHDISLSTSLIDPITTLLAVIFHILVVLLAVRLRRNQPLLSLAIFFFYIGHLVESTIIPLELIFEHRNYLPSMFLFVPLAQFINFVLLKIKKNTLFYVTVVGVICLILSGEGYATYSRNEVWNNEQSLWTDAARKAPKSTRPLDVLATLLAWNDTPTTTKYTHALNLYHRALQLRVARNDQYSDIMANMASIYSRGGDFKQAVQWYAKSLQIAPNRTKIQLDALGPLILMGNFPKAYKQLSTITPHNQFEQFRYYNIKGLIELWLAMPEKAINSFKTANRLSPGQKAVYLNLGKALSLAGNYQQAEWFFLRTWNKGNALVPTLCLIENSLLQQDKSKASQYFDILLTSHPITTIQKTLFHSSDQYRTVPLNSKILQPYIFSKIEIASRSISHATKK